MVQTFTKGAVADLVVILNAEHERGCWLIGDGRSARLTGRGRDLALINEPFVDCLRNRLHAPEKTGIVILARAGEVDAKIVMEIIGPNRVQPVSSGIPRANRANVVDRFL